MHNDLKSQESNLEVSERLRQLSTALKRTHLHEVQLEPASNLVQF